MGRCVRRLKAEREEMEEICKKRVGREEAKRESSSGGVVEEMLSWRHIVWQTSVGKKILLANLINWRKKRRIEELEKSLTKRLVRDGCNGWEGRDEGVQGLLVDGRYSSKKRGSTSAWMAPGRPGDHCGSMLVSNVLAGVGLEGWNAFSWFWMSTEFVEISKQAMTRW